MGRQFLTCLNQKYTLAYYKSERLWTDNKCEKQAPSADSTLEDARGFSGVKLMLEKPINNNSVGSEILQWPEFTRSIFEQA